MLWRMPADLAEEQFGTMFVHPPSVVSTGAPLNFARGKLRAQREGLLSTISCLSSREGLSTPPRCARLRSRRRKLVAQIAEITGAAPLDFTRGRHPCHRSAAFRVGRIPRYTRCKTVLVELHAMRAGSPGFLGGSSSPAPGNTRFQSALCRGPSRAAGRGGVGRIFLPRHSPERHWSGAPPAKENHDRPQLLLRDLQEIPGGVRRRPDVRLGPRGRRRPELAGGFSLADPQDQYGINQHLSPHASDYHVEPTPRSTAPCSRSTR